MRIGFLLNHEGAHQVGHVLPIALALAARNDEVEVEIFVARGAAEVETRRMAERRIRIHRLRDAGPMGRALTILSGGSLPTARISTLARNRDLFRDLDALVVPEKTSLMLRTRFGLRDLPLIHTRHGAGDRAVGFDKASGQFDLVLLSGNKIRDRLDAAGLLRPDGHAIVGYPKFDQLGESPPRLFDNDRPTVLYNPHPSPALSSWYRMGHRVLDWFASQQDYNLIFAPHVMLFAKRFNISLSPFSLSRVGKVPNRFRAMPHMYIDLGSAASVDMSYTRAADIYLGDASSQVYEFLAWPRPCIFLNPHDLPWKDDPNFAHWRAGPVVSSIDGLGDALHSARSQPDAFRPVQQELFSYSFDLTPEPSAQRAATAILEWLRKRRA